VGARVLVHLFHGIRSGWYAVRRVLVAEPLFKGYCASYGRNLRTGIFVHFVQGGGAIDVGDDVVVDGKSSFLFATRFSDRPTLAIGDRTGIGHDCTFAVAKRIDIGADCRIARGVWMFDSPGHPSEPDARRMGRPPDPDQVKPITIGNNVWIGGFSIIFPGVSIGEGSVIAAGSVIIADVPAFTVMAGNPARRITQLKAPAMPADVAPPA
jgi:acetyltransferase-like isoleucine patch superfamily enzyme